MLPSANSLSSRKLETKMSIAQGHRWTRTIPDVNYGLLSRRHGDIARLRRHEFGLVRPSDVLVEKYPRGN